MVDRIAAIGDAFEVEDGGAGRDELLRELTWVLEDTVAEVQEQEQADTTSSASTTTSSGRDAGDGAGSSSGGASGGRAAAWRPCEWRQLEMDARSEQRRGGGGGGGAGAWRLRLRAPVAQLHALWERRLSAREPFQYLIASAHWREFVLSVSPGVLIPRPETEIMPELAAAALAARPHLANLPWADLGTGSGAVAIGTAAELLQRSSSPAASATEGAAAADDDDPRVWAVDLSPVAVAHARYNVASAGLAGSVEVVQGSWCDPIVHLAGRLGGLLSNPPYIPRAQMAGLQTEVGRHEPATALDGGDGPGLDSLRVICADAVHMLAPGGLLALETAGREQAHAVAAMLAAATAGDAPGSARLREAVQASSGGDGAAAAFGDVAVVDDCYGVARFVTGTRSGE
ncbi:hypothetical protein FOA52_007248 [Chlamydomonas sp. UWO 241]|nr:hypothetical protein FOA52_007248 [Chlamydomonas sp. UWO 241]